MREELLSLLNKNSDLPPLPDVVIKLQTLIYDPAANAKTIASMLELDPVLAGRILQIANSVYYARSATPIKLLPLAITKIGFNMVIKLVYSLKVITLFSDRKLLDNKQFWRHSLSVALFTQELCKRSHAPQELLDVSYLAGLMHDVGIIVFGYLVPEKYGDFLMSIHGTTKPLEVLESETFGINHAEIGALFMSKWWEIDDRVCEAVHHHHDPFNIQSDGPQHEQYVSVANSICTMNDITNGIDCNHDVAWNSAWESLGLFTGDIKTIFNDVQRSLDQAEEIMTVAV